MARPRNNSKPAVVWNIKLLLYAGQHDDLIRVYRERVEGTRDGADVAITLMRSGVAGAETGDEETDDDEVFADLDSLTL